MFDSGDKTLAETLGLNMSSVKKTLDDELDKVQNGALDLSGAETQMKSATDDIQKNKGTIWWFVRRRMSSFHFQCCQSNACPPPEIVSRH